MIRFKKANIFSSGSEYEVFRYTYCDNGCIHHKEREGSAFPEFIENGGCPLEDALERARFDKDKFPDMLLEIWDDEDIKQHYHCPFFVVKAAIKK